MVELVIKIPEDVYKRTIFYREFKDLNDCITTIKALEKGTPLPEHHGRLGDLDALEEYFRNVRKELKASDYKNGTEFFVRDEMLLNIQQCIHLCDAIIEGSESE